MKKEILVMLASLMMLCVISSVYAAVTECVDASGNPQAGPGAYPMYNDTGVVTNVTLGQICVDAINYDVVPNVTYNCGNTSAMIDNVCTYTTYFTGFLGDGTVTCTNVGWVTGTTYTLAVGYIVNTTINASWATRGDYISDVGEIVPAKDACLDEYTLQGPTGYCDGAGALDTDGSLANATDGNVCIIGVDSQPDASVHCIGTADTWSDCVENQCTIDEYYVGYSVGNATGCSDTDWVLMGVSNPANGYRVSNTGHANLCTYVATGGTPTYTGCANAYTRNGTSGYCNGAGGDATTTLHVTEGNVCSAGANAQPGAGTNCGAWYNCVQGQSAINTYYVGYAASGSSCSDTDWVATGSHVDLANGLRARYTDHESTVCSTSGYNAAYNKGDFEPIITDAMGTAGVGVVSWADLAVTLLVVLFLGGAVLKYKKLF